MANGKHYRIQVAGCGELAGDGHRELRPPLDVGILRYQCRASSRRRPIERLRRRAARVSHLRAIGVKGLVLQLWRLALGALAFLRLDRTLLLVVLLSLAVWLIEGAVLWLGLLAFGLEPDPRIAYFTLVLIGIGVAVPSAPGYFGVFEACVILAFAAFALSREVALSYALVVHALQFAVIGVAGLVSLQVLGLSFGRLRQLGRETARLSDDGVPDRV